MPKYLIIISFMLFLAACGVKPKHDYYKEIDGEKWSMYDTISTDFEINDTIQLYNFFVNVRNNNNYEYSNLYVFVNTTFPNGKTLTDTVECMLAYPDGRWIGKGFGSVYDNRVLYKMKRRFPLMGAYTIDIIQAMRDEELEGILDVGFRLEDATKR